MNDICYDLRYLTDPAVSEGTRWITGANEPGHHVYDLVMGRDFTSDGVLDVAELREGDPAPDGSGTTSTTSHTSRFAPYSRNVPCRPLLAGIATQNMSITERECDENHRCR